MYDHPFQWGSKRTGPDLARLGGKYSNAWHVEHLIDPRAVVPESVMPMYGFLAEKDLYYADIADHMKTLRIVGVPYTDEQITNAVPDLRAQATDGDQGDLDTMVARYSKPAIGDFDGNPERITELDALIAYLQVLGTMVDFTTYKPEFERR